MTKDRQIESAYQSAHYDRSEVGYQQGNFSADFLLQMINSTSDPIFVKDRQHHWVLFNDALSAFLGLSGEQIIGKSDYELFPQEMADMLWEKDELVFTTGSTSEYEECITDLKGEKRIVSTKKCLFINDQNKQYLIGTIRDITKQVEQHQKVTQELRCSKQLLEQVLDSIPQAIFWKDCNSVYQGCNRFYASVAGLDTPLEIMGKTDYDLPWKKDETEWFRNSDRRVIESGLHESIIKPQQQADGRQGWLEINTIPINNTQGTTVGILGSFQDVTERKEVEVALEQLYAELEVRVQQRTAELSDAVSNLQQQIKERQKAEHELRSSQELLQLVIDNIPQLIFWKNRNFEYSGCNRKFANVMGVRSPQDIIGKTDDDLTWNRQLASSYRTSDRMVMESGTPELHVIKTQKQANGDKIWIDTNKIPLCDPQGKVVGIICTYEDITDRKKIEEDLRQSQVKLHNLSANVPGMLYQLMLCNKGEISFPYVSSGCDQIYGFTPEQVQADASLLISTIHRDERADFEKSLAFSAQTLEPWQWEGRIELASGQVKWIQAASRPEKQADGAIVWDGLIMDVTRRKKAERALQRAYAELEQRVGDRTQELAKSNQALQAEIAYRAQTEEALRASRQRLALLIEQTPLAVIEWDTNFHLQEWNPAAERIFGYTRDEVLGHHFEFVVPQNVKSQVEHLTVALLTQRGGAGIVKENLTKDHRTIICEWYNNPLIAADGEVIGIASMVLDITEREQAESALQEKEQFLRSIYDGVEQLIFVINVLDDQLVYAGWNSAQEKVTGISSAEALSKSPRELFGEHKGTLISQRYNSCLEAGIPITYEECWSYEGEESLWLTTIKPLRDAEGVIYSLVGTTFNITARKRAENQLKQQTQDLEQALKELQHTQTQLVQSEKMSSLGQLVAGVAHEINNPVNFIYGNLNHANNYTQDLLKLVQLYQQECPNSVPVKEFSEEIDLDFLMDDLPKLLHSVKVGAQRIREIVASLRTFSRMDEAEMKLVDIHEGINSTLMILDHRVKAKPDRAKIEVITDYSELPLVNCYAGQLNQVFMNILANAIDALEEEMSHDNSQLTIPQIKIATKFIKPNQVSICIADNGVGIPQDIILRLFDPFFTTKPVGKGTGMGLSISYQIITERHGGSLQCNSQHGEGTKFVITIPLSQELF